MEASWPSPRGWTSVDAQPDSDYLPSFDAARLVALLTVGGFALGIWLLVTMTIAPHKLLTYLAFFIPLWIALAALSAALLYTLRARRRTDSIEDEIRPLFSRPHHRDQTLDRDARGRLVLPSCVRQGGIAASIVLVNLALQAGHRWNLIPLILTLVSGGCLEALVWMRSGAENSGPESQH